MIYIKSVLVGVAGAIVAAAAIAAAQDRPAFEVASIKRTEPGRRGGLWGPEPGGRWRMVNTPIGVMVRTAYGNRTMELVGAPTWVDSEPYDVNAKAAGLPNGDEINLMLQSLLAERCKLVVHEEIRDRPIYALVVARGDGRLGPKLQPSKVDCEAFNAARRVGQEYRGPAPANGGPPCGWSSNGAMIRVGGLPMSRIGEAFGRVDGRPVVDKTGLTGNYEFTLESAQPSVPVNDPATLFTALQEQLGLKLVSDRAQVPVLVVDHIERPTEN